MDESVCVVNNRTVDLSSWTNSTNVLADERLITSSNVRIAVIAADALWLQKKKIEFAKNLLFIYTQVLVVEVL
jgi:hypothetical protein